MAMSEQQKQASRVVAQERKGAGLSWYLTGTGEIIRGQGMRDPDWEDRKAEALGGLTFLGKGSYGPGGNALGLLELFRDRARDPEVREALDAIIAKNRANQANAQYKIDHRHELRMAQKAEAKAMEVSAMVEAVRQLQAVPAAPDAVDVPDEEPPPRRRPGRPRKVAPEPEPEE